MSVGEMVFEIKPKDPTKAGHKGSQDKPCIVLTSMIKNESKIIERMLDSAAVVASHFCVVDTGSTDNTLDVVRAWAEKRESAMAAYSIPFTDFGTTRTATLRAGAEWVRKLGLDLDNTYLLLLDGDMTLEPAGFEASQLKDDNYRLEQYHGNLAYFNVRLVRASKVMRYIGRTHEYLETSGKTSDLYTLRIKDIDDGGCKADKFERDERLLRLDLEENPNNHRSMFYLAQTLQNLGRKAEALHWYDRRSKSEDFPEEAWAARYEASRCVTGFEQDVRALAAYYTRPQRAEPLADVACRASDRGQHHLAMALAKQGKALPYPHETLYCNPEVYRWPFRYAEMISAFYVGDMDTGAEACDFLHFTPGSPYANLALDNIVHYTKPLAGERTPFPVDPMDGFAPASPCFAKHEDGWIAMIRMVNYWITPNGLFCIPRDKVVTRNVIYHLDYKMRRVGGPSELISPPAPNPRAKATGFEDQRIVRIDGTKLITAGVRCDASPIGQPELWEATWDMSTGTSLEGRKLSKEAKIEKNWLPHMGGYLYNHDPQVTFVNGNGDITAEFIKPTINVAFFRGSAAPIPWKGGFLYVIHEVIQQGRRVYLHRFVHVRDSWWDGMRVTRPFFLKGGPCIESCFSINEVRKGVLMSCAYEDKEVYTITVSDETILNMLKEGFHE